MATTTNYAWETPDDTDLVKDGAAAIRTLGSSIDTTTKALNPSTTLGDIEYRSSTANTNTRLPIGSTGQVLSVSGGVPAWTSPSASTISYTLLNAGGTALTGASTITISGLSGYNELYVVWTGASTASSAADLSFRLNGDTGTNYVKVGMYFGWGASNAVTGNGSSSAAGSSFNAGKTASASATDGAGGFQISGANSTGIKPVIGWGTGAQTGGEAWFQSGHYAGTSVISSLSLISNGGNFDAGTIFIYGGK